MTISTKGFTLAQLLIVIGIIIFVSLVTLPALGQYTKDLELKNSTKEIISKLKLAQQYAVTEQVKHSLRFTPLDNSYYLIRKGEPETTLETSYLKETIYFASISGLENNEVVFNSAGAVDLNGEVYLAHLYTENQTLITIRPSGYVNWQVYQVP